MTEGSPDYTSPVRIQGLYGTTLKTIAVDEHGQLYALLKGKHGEVYVPLTLDTHGYITAILKGSDGTNLKTVLTDSAGRVINVLRDPTSNNYVAVDSEGYLTTVLKGSDGDGLHTILTDDAGRGIMVMRDPESDNYAKIDTEGRFKAVMLGQHNTTPSIISLDELGRMEAVLADPEDWAGVRNTIGLAELAVRLGSPVRFNRSGTVLFADDFSCGLSQWASGSSGTAGLVAVSNYSVMHGGYSILLRNGYTDNKWAHIIRHTPCALNTTVITIEIHFTMVTGADDYFEIYQTVNTGSRFLIFGVHLTGGGKLQVYDTTDNYKDMHTGIALEVGDQVWHVIRFKIDTDNEVYESIWIDDTAYGMDSESCKGTGSEQPRNHYLLIRQCSATADIKRIFIDTVILSKL